jgi:hypothetical protein
MVHSKKEFVLVHVDTEKESRGERRYIYNEWYLKTTTKNLFTTIDYQDILF